MGFTRYYTVNKNLNYLPEGFQNDVRSIIQTADSLGVKIAGWNGIAAPELSVKRLVLNGVDDSANGGEDQSFETFTIDLNNSNRPVNPALVDALGESFNNFGFCKTGRRPYDVIVGAILRSAKFHNVVTEYSSDGGHNEDAITDLLAAAGCAKRVA